MNIFRRVAVFIHRESLELLLALAVILLIAQLCWPSVARWWNLPSPGKIGMDQIESNSLARKFLIYLPVNYRDRQPWPLVVFLHGSGERGNDPNILRNEGPLCQKLPAIVAMPQCLPSHSWKSGAVAGFIQYIASRYQVDRNRIYLVGYSMGGYGTWQTAVAYPEMFAAIVPICGGGEPGDTKTLTGIPVWAFHGSNDDVIPLAESERMIEAIRDAGGKPRLTIIRDARHDICDSVCERSDLWEWLFMQRRKK